MDPDVDKFKGQTVQTNKQGGTKFTVFDNQGLVGLICFLNSK